MESKDFSFMKVDGGYAILGYTGNEENVVVPDSYNGEPVVSLIGKVFYENQRLKTVELPDTLKEICGSCFEECRSIKEIVIPNSVTILSHSAFKRCDALEKVVLSKQLKTMDNCCFFECRELVDCKLPEGLETIGMSAFMGCRKLKEMHIPSSMKNIGGYAFANCLSLERIVCSNADTNFSPTTFIKYALGTSKLIELPYFVWSNVWVNVNQNAVLMKALMVAFETFNEVEKQECISFLASSDYIVSKAFESGDIEIITFILTVGQRFDLVDIDIYLESSIKAKQTEVTALLLDYRNRNFSQEEIVAFNENQELVEIGLELPTLKQLTRKWKCYKEDDGLVVFDYKGDSVETGTIIKELIDGTKIVQVIAKSSESFNNIARLVIESEITEIRTRAFFRNNTLKEIVLPNTVKIIRESAFQNCSNLENIVVSECVEEIRQRAFYNCEKLKTIILPKSLAKIGDFAFGNCVNMLTVEYYDTTEISDTAFDGCGANMEIIVRK